LLKKLLLLKLTATRKPAFLHTWQSERNRVAASHINNHGVAFFLPGQPSLSLIGQENKRETRFPSVCTALAHHQTTVPNTCRLLQEKLFVVPANDDDTDDDGHD
jgi:hypothetical protein